jgi:putative NADH-flavin reductase
MRVAVIGASGGLGRATLAEGLARGWAMTGQTRAAARLADMADRVRVVEAAPDDAAALRPALDGADAVASCIGVRTLGPTTAFSDAARALIAAMRAQGPRRLVAVTGVGAGDTRGRGGWFYDRLVFPLFTARMYADKERQEALIEASGLDWVIVRPAPFSRAAPDGPLQAFDPVPPGLTLSRVTRPEVARFLLDACAADDWLGRRPFVGRP